MPTTKLSGRISPRKCCRTQKTLNSIVLVDSPAADHSPSPSVETPVECLQVAHNVSGADLSFWLPRPPRLLQIEAPARYEKWRRLLPRSELASSLFYSGQLRGFP
jgi:hypothetical protein